MYEHPLMVAFGKSNSYEENIKTFWIFPYGLLFARFSLRFYETVMLDFQAIFVFNPCLLRSQRRLRRRP
jgi:hypothetical protein